MSFKNLKIALGASLLLGATAGRARAQEAVVTEAISDDTYDSSQLYHLEGHGYELTSGLMLHTSVGVEGGASSNVFFESSGEDPTGAGLLRVVGNLYLSNAKPTNSGLELDTEQVNDLSSRDYDFQGGLRLSYNEFLSSDQAVRDQRQLNVLAAADIVTKPDGPFSLIGRERFVREMRSPNLEDTSTINRDDNRLFVGVKYQTEDHALAATLHYDNWLNVFEDTSPYPGRMNHTFGIGTEYQLGNDRRTLLVADLSYGFFGPLGDGDSKIYGVKFKTASQPFRAVVGVARELTPQSTLKLHGGFAHASYDARTDGRDAGYNAPIAGAELAAKWSETGKAALVYDYDHFDALNANFYADHLFALKLVQQLGFAVIDGGPEVRLRKFSGIPMALGDDNRKDTVVAARARLTAVLAERFAFSAEYRLSMVNTDYRAIARDSDGNVLGMDNPSFTRHEVTVGVTAAY